MMKLVAVQGCTINVIGTQVVPPGEVPPAGVPVVPTTGTWQITTPPSINSKVDNKGIYTGPCILTVPSGSTGQGTLINSVTLTFQGSTTQSTIDSKKILLQNESSDTQTGNFQVGQSSVSFQLVATITIAGQTSTFAE